MFNYLGEEGFNIDGQTPLWLAAAKGHEAIVRLLIKEGADIHIKDKHGRTPLLLAAMKGHEAILQLLLNKGADTRMVNNRARPNAVVARG